jgi:ketosteroid isomerase-like protein
MRKLVLFLMFFVFWPRIDASSQEPSGWRAATEARDDAQAANDVENYGKSLTDDFLLTSDTGIVSTAPMMRADVANRKRMGATPSLTVNRFDEKVRVYGDTVIHTYGATSKASGVTKRYTYVWVKQKEQWKLANLQASPIATP